MKNLNSKNADFENVSTDNLSFNSINSDSPQSVNDVLAWNGSSWEVKPAADLGVGGGGGGAEPSSFASSIPAGVESHAITYGPFASTPRIASSLEINGDGEIIPYTMSGVSETGYHVIFSEATPNTNYNIHTVFGGESGGESGGLSYNEVIVTVSGGKFYIDGTQQLQLSLQRGLSYRFDQSDSTNSAHPIKFSTLSDGTHNTPGGSEYTAGIVYSGTPGSAGAYTEVTLSQSSPNLYYYCANHSGMGGSALGEITLKANGNVGIGATDPKSLLTVNAGNVSDAGTWAASALAIENPTNIGAYSQVSFGYSPGTVNAAAYLGFLSTNQGDKGYGDLVFGTRSVNTDSAPTERMRIDSSGNVGIGTTSPNASLAVQDSSHGGQIQIGSSSGADQYQYINFANNWQIGKNNSTANSIGPAGSLYIYNMDESATSLCIDSNSNVGIGTTSPDATLTVSRLDQSETNAALSVYRGDTSAGNRPTAPIFNAFNGAAGGTEVFRVQGNGNVGVGTTSPDEPLHVVDNRVDGTGKPVLKLSSPAIPSGMFSHSVHALNPNLTAEQNQIIILGKQNSLKNSGYVGYKWYEDGSDSNLLTFGHYGRDNLVNITPTGRVGIGTVSPDCQLSVSGDIRLGTFESTSSSDNKMYYIKSAPFSWSGYSAVTNEIASIGLGSNNTGQDDGLITFSTTLDANLGGTLTERMRINSNGALCINSAIDAGYKLYVYGSIFGTSGTLSSDDRVKHNEQNIVGAIETLGKITPKKYIKTIEMYDANHDFELDENGNPVDENGESVEHRIEAGVIAQQVLAVDELAFAVSAEGVDEDGVVTSPHGLDYNSLFTYAIAAIQEQQKLIEDLRSEVEVLKNK